MYYYTGYTRRPFVLAGGTGSSDIVVHVAFLVSKWVFSDGGVFFSRYGWSSGLNTFLRNNHDDVRLSRSRPYMLYVVIDKRAGPYQDPYTYIYTPNRLDGYPKAWIFV